VRETRFSRDKHLGTEGVDDSNDDLESASACVISLIRVRRRPYDSQLTACKSRAQDLDSARLGPDLSCVVCGWGSISLTRACSVLAGCRGPLGTSC
jgi:hypothetical protein